MGLHAGEHAKQQVMPATSTVLDRAHLARVTLGSAELAREVLDLFAGQVPHQIEALESSGPGRPWFEAAHGLKGSARAVGAWALAETAAAAERMAGDADGERREAMLAAVRAIATTTLAAVRAAPV